MPIFVERFVLPTLAAALILLLATNPMQFDTIQRVAGSVVVVSLAFFCAYSLHLHNRKHSDDNPVSKSTGNVVTPAAVEIQGPERQSDSASKKSEGADVTLRLVHPSHPSLKLINLSDEVASDVKYTVVLWNRDLPDRADPLPIPVATFDFLNPRASGGPQELFRPVLALLKPGDRLYGTASVVSKGGARGHTFVVRILWGQGGWFAENTTLTQGEILIPKRFLPEDRAGYFDEIDRIDPQLRVPIEDLGL